MKQLQKRWVFADIKGKGDRYRTVAIPEYAMKCLEEWLDISKTAVKTDRIFFSIRKNGEIGNTMITPQGIRAKTKLTLNFMQLKMREYDELKKELRKK